jgi:hypothetical protein
MIYMKAKIKLFFCLLIVLVETDGFSEESRQKAENIQSPQLRKEISQLRTKIDQPTANWKLIGFAEKRKTRADMLFYDSSSLEILENGILRLWIKDVKAPIIKKNENDSDIIGIAAEKAAEGYVPPCMKVSKSKFEDADAHEIILFETIAKMRQNQPYTMMQTEIDMGNLKFRTLLIRVCKPNGTMETGAHGLDWNKIEPGSNFETLYKILKER